MLHLPYYKNRAEYTIQSINVWQFSSCFINLDYKGSTFWGNIQKNRVFLVKYLVNSKKSSTFAPAFEKKRVFLAQLVEQLTLNQWVQGSSPWEDTKRHPFGCLFLYSCGTRTLQITRESKRLTAFWEERRHQAPPKKA